MHKVSVCIYTKNRAHWLPEAINSVLAQKGVDLELLILDDGSTDDTPAVLADYASKHPCIRLFQKGDPHLFSLATGDYVCSLPDDDLLLGDDSLRRRGRVLEQNPDLAFVFSTVRGHTEDGKDRGLLTMGRISTTDVLTNAVPFDKLFIDCFVPWPSGMFRRTDLDFDEDYPGDTVLSRDWFWWQRLSKLGDQAYLAEPTVSLRSHEGQQSNTEGLAEGGFLKIHFLLWEYWVRKGHSPTLAEWREMCRVAKNIEQLQHAAGAPNMKELDGKLQALKPAVTPPSVCLAMIVKDDFGDDEAHVIERCLDSTYGLISHLVVVPTSKTKAYGEAGDLAKHWAKGNGIPIRMQHIRWVDDFGKARNVAHELAVLSGCDWILLLDADEELNADPEKIAEVLVKTIAPVLMLPMISAAGRIIPRTTFIRNIPGWNWEGRLHETPMLKGDVPQAELMGDVERPLAGPHVSTKQDGARSRDPKKLEKDIDILTAAHEEMRSPRDLFFLGEAWWIKARTAKVQDEHALRAALDAFTHYLNVPYQKGMAYYAHLTIGRIHVKLGSYPDALASFFKAYSMCPTRVEALGEVAQSYAMAGQWPMAKIYALACAHAPKPDPATLEFLEPEWAAWKGLLLLVQALVNLNQLDIATMYLELLLTRQGLPEDVKAQMSQLLKAIKTPQDSGQPSQS